VQVSNSGYMPIEWVRVATDVVRIRIWEGKPLMEIFYPYVVAGIALFALIWKKMREKAKTINAFMGITFIVAALYCGSGLAVLHHCLVSVALAGGGPDHRSYTHLCSTSPHTR